MLRRSNGSSQLVRTPMVENLERRELFALSDATVFGIKVSKLPDTDGTSLNSNYITVVFNKPITLLDSTKIRSWGYAEDLLTVSGQRKVTVGLTITGSNINGKGVLTMTTDRLIRKGSRLFLDLGAVQDASGNDIVFDGSTTQKTITFTVGQNKPRYTMANRNWHPTDFSFFSNEVFAASPTPTTASTIPSTNVVRADLLSFLNQKVAKGILTSAQVTTGMAIFDNTTNKAIVNAPNLLAGLVSLLGTVGEPAIAAYLNGANATGKPATIITFSSGTSSNAVVAETTITPNNRLRVTLKTEFSGESFINLGAILAHESMHEDTANTTDEELLTNAVETIVYGQQLLVNPTPASAGTELATRQNQRLMAMLNSGDTLFPYGGIYQAPALLSPGNVFPGAISFSGGTIKSFKDWVNREYVARGFSAGGTTSNIAAQTILKNIVGSTGNFTLLGSTVAGYLDKGNKIFTDVTYIALARILKLTF